jgi:hypothetical protein
MIYTIFSTSTKYQHLYISLILKELFPVMKNLLQFDRTTFISRSVTLSRKDILEIDIRHVSMRV